MKKYRVYLTGDATTHKLSSVLPRVKRIHFWDVCAKFEDEWPGLLTKNII